MGVVNNLATFIGAVILGAVLTLGGFVVFWFFILIPVVEFLFGPIK